MVEIYNPTGSTVDLAVAGVRYRRDSSCSLDGAAHTENPGAHRFRSGGWNYVIAGAAKWPFAPGDFAASALSLTSNHCVLLTQGPETFDVADTAGNLHKIDLVAWGTVSQSEGTPVSPATTTANWIKRCANGTDTNSNSTILRLQAEIFRRARRTIVRKDLSHDPCGDPGRPCKRVASYLAAHVLLCLVPAFFVAGALSALVPQQSIIRFLGPRAPRWVSYSAAASAGSLLAVCSCTVQPLFAGIYKRGAGLRSGRDVFVLPLRATSSRFPIQVLHWEPILPSLALCWRFFLELA